MNLLYLTADKIGIESGGGKVTDYESQALQSLGECEVLGRDQLEGGSDPWGFDDVALSRLSSSKSFPKLCHIYSGSFSKTAAFLKEKGCKLSWTVAAHDVDVSRREHLALGLPFPYLHLNNPILFQKYIEGYKQADVIVVPGSVPMETMKKQGINGRYEIIPHGCTLAKDRVSLPNSFRVGYLGAFAADKGVRYLFEAWAKLRYKDATLVLGGKDSLHPWVGTLLEHYGVHNVVRLGWVNNVADFYNSISLFICPASTEGFNLETIEAMAHHRPVICSDGAGAVDIVAEAWRVPACNADKLTERIESFRKMPLSLQELYGRWCYKRAEGLTWEKVQARYKNLWKTLL